MKTNLKNIYILGFFSISIVFLYYLSNNEKGKDIDQLHNYTSLISHEYQNLDYLILQYRAGKIHQFDDLNNSLNKIKQSLNQSLGMIGSSNRNNRKSRNETTKSTLINSKAQPILTKLSKDFEKVEKKIEQFKSSISILNNSLRYLFFQYELNIDNNSATHKILDQFLFYVLAINTIEATSYLEKMNRLNDSIQASDNNKVKNLSRHLDITTNSLTSIVSIYNEILNKGLGNDILELNFIVEDARQQHIKMQGKYNAALFLLIILMSVFIIFTLIKMHIVNKQLTVSRHQAVAANKSKSLFLANMSHELRTPMHSILSYSEFGIQRAEKLSTEKTSQYFTNINSSGKRLLSLLNTLLDLSKIEAGKMSYDISSNSLNETIESVISEFSLIVGEKNLTLDFQNSQDVIFDFDHEKIGQVIRNIINNAIKFSWNEEKISIITDESSNNVTVSVYNVGDSIPKDELQTIFNSFQQSKISQNGAGGTGLGLAICKGIVSGHHGKIWANCIEDNTTVFTFSLPKTQPSEKAEQDDYPQDRAA